jgi:hypothetical protein
MYQILAGVIEALKVLRSSDKCGPEYRAALDAAIAALQTLNRFH